MAVMHRSSAEPQPNAASGHVGFTATPHSPRRGRSIQVIGNDRALSSAKVQGPLHMWRSTIHRRQGGRLRAGDVISQARISD
jgi:hypothetical protein